MGWRVLSLVGVNTRISETPCINFPGYIPNLTSVKGNLKIYNKVRFFKTLPRRTGKMLFNIRALSVFRYEAEI
jgi:hypothetical protein